jgi:uncharacterized delta-60 repeat protein
VERLNTDGSLDTTFNKTGSMTIQTHNRSDFADAVAVQPDGKIVVGGASSRIDGRSSDSESLVARLTPNGTLDPTFGSGGLWLSPGGQVQNLAVLTDAAHTTVTGIVGFRPVAFPGAVVKLTPAGVPDSTFGSGGVAVAAGLSGITFRGFTVSAAGEIYVSGTVNSTGCLAALTPAGVLDSTFGGGTGYVLFSPAGFTYSEFDAVAVQTVTVGGQSVSRVVVAGYATVPTSPNQYPGLVVGYTLGGSLDTTFGAGGWFTTAPMAGGNGQVLNSLALEADGSIVVGGWQHINGTGHVEMLIGHLTANGAADPSFGPSGTGFTAVQDGSDSEVFAVAIDPTGNILACGYGFATPNAARQAAVVRLTAP